MDSTSSEPLQWLHQQLAQLRLRWLFSGLGLCLLSAWWLPEAWVMGRAQLIQALVTSLVPGLALLYRGLRPVDPDSTLGYLLIWIFIAGLVRSLEQPETLVSVHTLVGVGLFLLPGLLVLHLAEGTASPPVDEAPQSPRYDGRYRGPYEHHDNTDANNRGHHNHTHGPAGDPLRDAYLALLGLPEQATPAQIRRAYRRNIARYHPDRASGGQTQAEEQAVMINLAYDYLLRRRQDC